MRVDFHPIVLTSAPAAKALKDTVKVEQASPQLTALAHKYLEQHGV